METTYTKTDPNHSSQHSLLDYHFTSTTTSTAAAKGMEKVFLLDLTALRIYIRVACESGGIGRRAGFRFLCPLGCGGSTPPFRIRFFPLETVPGSWGTTAQHL